MVTLTDTQYIGYVQLEELLRKLTLLKALLNNLYIELDLIVAKGREGFIGTDEQVMYAMSMAAQVLSDMPRVESVPGDKATRIVASHEDIADEQYSKVKQELIIEITTIASVIEKVNAAIRGLREEDKRMVINEFYIKGSTWKQIAHKLNIAPRYVSDIMRKEAMSEMLVVLKVNRDDWKFCMERVRSNED